MGALSAAPSLATESFFGTLYPTRGLIGLSGDTCRTPSGSVMLTHTHTKTLHYNCQISRGNYCLWVSVFGMVS